jgi:hypothetical protein
MRKFIFPITTGRSGSMFLTKLIQQNMQDIDCHHELTGPFAFGVDSPEVSQSMQFNMYGNTPYVREFWKRKMDRILHTTQPAYAEISHMLFKAGLVENIHHLTDEGEVHLILLTRDITQTHWSFVLRNDFINRGLTWLYTLDCEYSNTIVSSQKLKAFGAKGAALWYIYETFARMEYYALLMKDHPRVKIHRIDLSDLTTPIGSASLLVALGHVTSKETVVLPARQNESDLPFNTEDRLRSADFVASYSCDTSAIARTYFRDGRRLAFGGRTPCEGQAII